MIKNLIKPKKNNFKHKYYSSVVYIQGQEPEPKVREYFYYIDHQGMLFLDDARIKNFTSCLKDKKFLRFFFKQLRINKTNRYTDEFPYLSICGKERNFVRCDDYPIVFTHILEKDSIHYLSHNHAGGLLITKFYPSKIFMLPSNGRVYHPASEKYGGIGLVRSKLAIELSKSFTFTNDESSPPTHYTFNGIKYDLDLDWFYKIKK